jgi:hypothetical protein
LCRATHLFEDLLCFLLLLVLLLVDSGGYFCGRLQACFRARLHPQDALRVHHLGCFVLGFGGLVAIGNCGGYNGVCRGFIGGDLLRM